MANGTKIDSGATAIAPGASTGMFATAKQYGWQFLGSMWMEQKGGSWAISLHRVLGTLMFAVVMYLWLTKWAIPDAMVYTLWGLLGINGAKSLTTQAVKALQNPDSGTKKAKK